MYDNVSVDTFLLNPQKFDGAPFDEETRQLMRAFIDWYEGRGKKQLVDDYADWHRDFLNFAGEAGLYSSCLIPAEDSAGEQRWDTARNSALNELLGFYGINGWYTWHVSILGLLPIWGSSNTAARKRAVELLKQGHSAAFALSEKEHGADIYSTDMRLEPASGGQFVANGAKYYIGNGNVAGLVTVFGRRTDIDGVDGYMCFIADSRQDGYRAVRNVANQHLYVGEIALENYVVRPEDILHTGRAAFDVALNSVNIGKFNLSGAGLGATEHALYESLNHAHNRELYGRRVTTFPHVRRLFSESYLRLVAMKLFTGRAAHYIRAASAEDRRYILFAALSKVHVTTEAERVMSLLWDVIAAKGFEANTHFNWVARDLPGLPRLEGTVHVNTLLVLKFMRGYFTGDASVAPVPDLTTALSDDSYVFQQAGAGNLGDVRFADWRTAFDGFAHLENVRQFREQAEQLLALVSGDGVAKKMDRDIEFALAVGPLFTLVVYGQLVLEQASLLGADARVVDSVFNLLVKDFSGRLVEFHGHPSVDESEQAWAMAAVRRPHWNEDRDAHVEKLVESLVDAYEMGP
ncbi:acyl-CoA dehydrogenase [Streptomyces cadmiisoli]|uniref:Acyl-CoA dehydrogenase n=1 Tax=Streptomyces cadmiisoli TaxID=2184053 RepID=A0A2Z4J9P9_9ACTN|nr:acyl-CoA dehydrogenase [Streptomyces cadmiisoli]